MIKIKISTPWNHINFNTRVSTLNGNPNYNFFFDDDPIECDFWVIWGGIKGEKEKAICNPANIIYLTDEVNEQRFFNKFFLNQFAAIITCRSDLKHPSIISNHELNTWMIDRNYDWLYADKEIPKTKSLSVISSDQTWLPGHKLRFAFVNKLIGHFKDRLDVFGKGFNPVNDKYDALADYKYSIAIENSVIPGYFTEKITDCYLTQTMPLYYGCPDIDQYFDTDSLRLIDPNNFKDSVLKIEQIIEEVKLDFNSWLATRKFAPTINALKHKLLDFKNAELEIAAENLQTANFSVAGMTCAVGCAKTIQEDLTNLDGVQNATVDFETKSATVTFDKTVQNPENLTKVVLASGDGKTYTVSNMKS